MKQRVLISGPLLHDPVFIDPRRTLSGIGVSSELFQYLLTELAGPGKTILYISQSAGGGGEGLRAGGDVYKGKIRVRDSVEKGARFESSAVLGEDPRAVGGTTGSAALGNNSAVIVEPDAGLATALTRTTQGAFSHSGQVCISVQRVFAHRSIAGEFTERLTAPAQARRSAIPARTPPTFRRGARKFATVTPTVLVDVPAACHISCQEAFGPLVAIYPCDDLSDAIERANATPYGLQAGIFTNDLQRAFRAARRLEVGGVMINDIPMYRADHMPYGGVKESGTGREGPRYAIEEMTEMKLICWKV
jgi:acyl-CoA reductase-like NAD-dependent aldehyde dehydrogenase